MTIKSLLLGAAIVSFAACNQKENSSEHLVAGKTDVVRGNIDSLDNAFDENWNKDDSAALVNSLADDVILLSGRDKYQGKKEVAEKWISGHLPITANLKTEVVQKGADAETAYSAGTWSLELNLPGKPAQTVTGNHTFIYRKQADGSWKTALINIEDHDPESPGK